MNLWGILTTSSKTNQSAREISRLGENHGDDNDEHNDDDTEYDDDENDAQETQQHCSVCEEVITGTYYSLGDKIYCEKDYMVVINIIIIIIITTIIVTNLKRAPNPSRWTITRARGKEPIEDAWFILI